MTVSKSNNDYVPNITKYALKGYDLVIAVGFLEEQAVGQVAKKFPDVKFAIIDDSVTVKALKGLKNVEGILYKEQEAGYLVGYLAGLFEKTNAKGLNSQQVISSRRRHRDPAGRPLHRRLPVRRQGGQPRHQAAQRLLRRLRRAGQVPGPRPAADRTGLGHHLPGRGPVRPRRHQRGARQGLLGRSASTPTRRSQIGSKQLLASATKGVDVSVVDVVGQVVNNKFRGGKDLLLGINEKGAGIQGINSAVPAAIKAKLNALIVKMKAGKVKIPTQADEAHVGVADDPPARSGFRGLERRSGARAPRDHEAVRRRSSPTTRSTSICGRARSTPCSARTERASRRS